MTISTEDRNLPFLFEFKVDEKDRAGNFKISMDKDTKIKNHLKWEKFTRAINTKNQVFIIDNNIKKPIMSFQSDFALPENDKWYGIIKKLDYIEKSLGIEIDLPENLSISDDDAKNIDSVFKIVSEGKNDLKVNDIGFTVSKSTVKQLIKQKNENENSVIRFSSKNTSIVIFGKKIDLGVCNTTIENFEFLNKDSLISSIEKSEDDEDIEVKIIPEDGKLSHIFPDYS